MKTIVVMIIYNLIVIQRKIVLRNNLFLLNHNSIFNIIIQERILRYEYIKSYRKKIVKGNA